LLFSRVDVLVKCDYTPLQFGGEIKYSLDRDIAYIMRYKRETKTIKGVLTMRGRSTRLKNTAALILTFAFLIMLGLALGSELSGAAAGNTMPAGKSNAPTEGKGIPQTGVAATAGTIVSLVEGFEDGLGSFNSFSSCGNQNCSWGPVMTAYHTGSYSAYAADAAGAGEGDLVLAAAQAIPVDATSATLTFWHRYGFESNGTFYYDGGVIEASTDGGITWADAGANITTGGYNGTISSCCGNPLAGRAAWGGTTSGNWGQVVLNLMPYRGPGFLFRLRLGTDGSNASDGWWVDDVQVSYDAPLASCAQTWATVNAYPDALRAPAVVGLGGLLYSFGGRTSSAATASSYSYNPGNDTWTPIAVLPTPRYMAGAVTDGTYIYIVGGVDAFDNATATLWRYDPGTNSYLTLAPFTIATAAQGTAYLNGKVYRIAGETDVSNSLATNTVEAYDIATNTWATVASYPSSYYALSALSLNGYIYTAGGAVLSYTTAKAYRFDPGSNTWDGGPIADLPGAGAFMASGFYNNRWVLAPDSRFATGSAIAWDPSTNSWSSLNQMPQGITQAGGGVAGGAFYVVGGRRTSPVDTVQKYVETSCSTPSPTSTAVAATPTACALQFTDVPSGSTFYAYVRCLACRGILTGYPCGGAGEPCDPANDPYFRPNNNITRGQIAKVVANAAGYQDPQTTQLFEDVVPGSTFFDFIGRLASRGYMSGYPCGGAGEPCGSGNLPYFRPNSNASRGQISKIVSNTAGYQDPQTIQMFEDVVPGSTFFDFIGRLASRGIMSGYPCGGAGEPCGSGNLPYFRPTSNASRAQTSKIVANTFLPSCNTP
jgi:hypothetical protein